MARAAVIQREFKKQRLEEKYRDKSSQIKAELSACYATLENDANADVDSLYEQIEALQVQLEQIPRNATKKRQRNRCELTGRPRGYYRKFKLSRNMLRKLAMMGYVPGITKASW